MSLRRLLTAVAVLAATLALAACGNKEETVTAEQSSGVPAGDLFLDVGGLTYQVQISRQLNPRDVEDRGFIGRLPEGTPPLKPNESWFGVFVRIWNEGEEPVRSTEPHEFRVIDTQWEEGDPCVPSRGCFLPVELEPQENPFAYSPSQIDPGEVYPPASSAAYESVIGGALLLYRLPNGAFENRPLELEIAKPGGVPEKGFIELDV